MAKIINPENYNFIALDKNYYMTVDEHNFILVEKIKRNKIDIKTKKETDKIVEFYEILGYYNTIKDLAKACISYDTRKEINNKNFKTLSEIVKAIDAFENRIENIISGY